MNDHHLRAELHLALTSDTDHASTAWFVAKLPKLHIEAVTISIHFGLISIASVLLPLFFLRMSHGTEQLLLETSLNPYEADFQGLMLLRCLSTQASYQLQCQDLTTKTERILDVPNTHHALYRQAVQLLEAHPPWTDIQFIQAQYHLAHAWSTPEERYQYLQHPPYQAT